MGKILESNKKLKIGILIDKKLKPHIVPAFNFTDPCVIIYELYTK